MSRSEPNAVVVFADDPEAATYRTDIAGWISRTGHFYGDREREARYDGSTHKRCTAEGCDEIYPKNWSSPLCQTCRDKNRLDQYFLLAEVSEFEYPLTLWDGDKWFWNEDDIQYYCEDHFCQPSDLLLITSKMQKTKGREINPYDHFEDILPDTDGYDFYKLPKEIEEAFEELNKKISTFDTPLSYTAGNKRVSLDFEVELDGKQIIINGKHEVVEDESLSYEEVVKLAGFADNTRPTVTYRHAYAGHSGELLAGGVVYIINSTTFNVANTGNA